MIDVRWEDEQHSIVGMAFEHVWTQEDYANAFWQMLELVEGQNCRLDLINLIGQNVTAPSTGITDLIHAALKQLPRQFGMIVTVNGSDRVAQVTATLDDRMALTNMPFKLVLTDTLAQALAIIATDRALTGNRTTA